MRSIILSTEPIEAIREAWAALKSGDGLAVHAPHRKHSTAQVAWFPWHGKWDVLGGTETRCLFTDIVSAIGSTEPIEAVWIEKKLTFQLRKPYEEK